MFRVSGFQGLRLGFQGPTFRVSRPPGLCLGFKGPAFRVSRPQSRVFFQVFPGFSRFFMFFLKVFPCFLGFSQGFSEEGLPPRPFHNLVLVFRISGSQGLVNAYV